MALYKVPAYFLPAPTQIGRTFVAEFPRLLYHGWVTAYEMLLGYGLAVAVAVPLAIAITSSPRFDSFVMPHCAGSGERASSQRTSPHVFDDAARWDVGPWRLIRSSLTTTTAAAPAIVIATTAARMVPTP